MRDYIVRRLLILVPVMIGVSLLTFSLFNIIPGDACVLRLGFGSTPETLKACREAHGLTRPLFPVSINSDVPVIHVQDSQYGGWLWDIVAHQDLGQSLAEGSAKVSTELERRLPITLELMIMTVIFALVLGILPGMLSAIRPNTPIDWIARVLSVLWLSIPSFYLAILMITFGLLWFGWTPPQFGRGYVPFMDDPWVNLQQFVFQSLTLLFAFVYVSCNLFVDIAYAWLDPRIHYN